MKKGIALAGLLFCFTCLFAQTPANFVREVKANTASMTALSNIIRKHAIYKDTLNYWSTRDTIGYLNFKKVFGVYRFLEPVNEKDTNNHMIYLFATYRGDQVGYIRIEEGYHDHRTGQSVEDTLLTYVDTTVTNSVLSDYNQKHKTDFTWQDLYEDGWNRYCRDAGLIMDHTDDFDSTGYPTPYLGLTYEIKQCLPLILNKDHKAIIRYCKSFNPARKAYGAVSLYSLLKMGEPLSTEEKQLLKTIRRSSETTDFSYGCILTPNKKLKDILTKSELESVYIIALEVQQYKKKSAIEIQN